MEQHWFKQAVIYCLDVETFQDSNGDGIGDIAGLTRRLDYLARLGVTCIWLNPVHPTPNRDDGYDITDYYGVDSRLGSLGDFVELVNQAANRGLRVIIDLVVNHTSDEHPWFQSARSSPDSPYRDWYIWSPSEPVAIDDGVVFPGKQKTTWTYDETAEAWYHHRFYDFQPDLNWANPEVRAEVAKIVAFWLQLGVAGFRLDAAPFVIEDVHPDERVHRREFRWLEDLSSSVSWRKGDAVILAEANVEEKELGEFFVVGPRLGGTTARGPRRHDDDPAAVHLGVVPSQPRRDRLVRAQRDGAAGVLRRVRSEAGDAVVRTGDPPSTDTDAQR